MIRVFDPYAIALSLLVGGVGFGMTFYFNTRVSAWGSEEIAYPALAMIYVYARNARFFEDDAKSANELLEGNTSSTGKNGSVLDAAAAAQKIQAPPADSPGLSLVTGTPLKAPGDGQLTVVFFFASWCAKSERYLPAILALAARYSEEGISFTGVTQESEDDLRYFVETYQRPLRSVTLLADTEGDFTAGYQEAHKTKTIPHCYVVRGGGGGRHGFGVVEWHGHPTRLESALGYFMDCADQEQEGGGAEAEIEVEGES